MSNRAAGLLLVLALLLPSCGGGGGGADPVADPIVVTLRNDTYEPGDPRGFTTTFGSGRAFGATLGPAPVVMTLDRIDYQWGPEGVSGLFDLYVYRDTGVAEPGAQLLTVGRQLEPTADGWQTFDISTANILLGVGQSVRFVIEYRSTLAVGPGYDEDGTNTAGQNWVFSGTVWSSSSSSLIPGDWIVRGIGTMSE